MIYVVDGLIYLVVGLHRQHRTKDLVLHDLQVFIWIDDQSRWNFVMWLLAEVFIRRIDLNNLNPFVFCFIDVAIDAIEMSLVDDGGVVRVV